MMRSRAIRFAVCGGLTLTALGCTQIAGLTDDYHLASAGAGGSAGVSGGAGASGEAGEANDAGAAGTSSANGGASGGDGGAANANGGASGANAGTAGTSAGPGGTSGSAGTAGGAGTSGSAGMSGSAGTAGSAGAGGSSGGPVRVGFSEFHDSASGGDNASSHLANASFAKPSGTKAGDLILVFFGADHSLQNMSGLPLALAGWTLLDQHENYGTDGQATYLIYKFASGSEPDPIVFSGINPATSGDGVQGLLSVYRGVNALSPINAYQTSLVPTGKVATHVTSATPAITTTTANCLLIAGLSPDTTVDAPVVTSWPDGFAENQVSVNNPTNPYPYGWANIYSAERHLAAAGSVPASAFAWTVSNGGEYYGSLTFVIALAP